MKLKNSNCDETKNLNCDEAQLNLRGNSKTMQSVTKQNSDI